MTEKNLENTNLSDRVKLLRIGRFILFIVLYAAVDGFLRGLVPDDIKHQIKSDALWHSVAVIVMIVIEMLLIYLGGARWLEAWTAVWHEQWLGIAAFLWGIATARALGALLARWLAPDTENEGIIVLFFFLGMILLAPFQYLAMRAYGKRKGIPIWPNLPRD